MKKIRLITIGDELLDGRVRDHNAWWLGARARRAGARLVGVTCVPDDRTREALAAAAGVGLALDDEAVERLRARYAGRGRALDDAARKQAVFPDGARILQNPIGTADGFQVSCRGVAVSALPGVPSEFERLAESVLVAPPFEASATTDATSLALVGLFESEAASIVRDVIGADADALTWRAAVPIVEVGLSGIGSAERDRVRGALAPWSLPDGIMHPAVALGEAAARAGVRIATAESCTGGRVASWMTDVPGASAWFDAGFVTYADAAKMEVLGVPASTLSSDGAVSRRVARAMAVGARRRAGADVAVSLTGIAGPGGGSDEKPVGTVWIACATPTRVDVARAWFAHRDRTTFKSLAAALALRMAASALDPSIDPSLFRGVQEYHRDA